MVGFCSCEIGGWWKKSKSLWGSLLLHVLFKMSNINLLGLLRVFMVLTSIVIEIFYEMNWLVCLVGRSCHGALG